MKPLSTFNHYLTESVESTTARGNFLLELLYVRDQAHIFHWQTSSYAQHKAFGLFYDDYLDLVDAVAEQVFGKMGKFFMGGNGTITLVDYSSQAIESYLSQSEAIFRDNMQSVIPVEGNEEIYNTVEEILSLINKLRYLLSLS